MFEGNEILTIDCEDDKFHKEKRTSSTREKQENMGESWTVNTLYPFFSRYWLEIDKRTFQEEMNQVC